MPDSAATEGDLEARHHASHHGLLHEAPPSLPSPVDAIIVPTSRPASTLVEASKIARAIGSPLVLLCSRRSDVVEAHRMTDGVRTMVIDANDVPADVVPSFETTGLLSANGFSRGTDTSAKRNLGLLLAVLAGWQRVVFLDDDIEVPDPRDLRVAAGLLDTYDGVGLTIEGFPDNSVVCHAYRDAGNDQKTFVGGGALAVGRSMFRSFFPDIYNEDWFFLLNGAKLRPTTVAGRAVQRSYDPYADPSRARTEELGDCLAEGLFSLLDQGLSVSDADRPFWDSFMADRRKLIITTVEQAGRANLPAGTLRRMKAALEAAREQSEKISPELCVAYLGAWQRDRRTWRRYVRKWTRRARQFDRSDLSGLVDLLDLPHLTRMSGGEPAGLSSTRSPSGRG